MPHCAQLEDRWHWRCAWALTQALQQRGRTVSFCVRWPKGMWPEAKTINSGSASCKSTLTARIQARRLPGLDRSRAQTTSPLSTDDHGAASWLNQPAFRRLIEATDGYVLQVHSLERPKGINSPCTLCDRQPLNVRLNGLEHFRPLFASLCRPTATTWPSTARQICRAFSGRAAEVLAASAQLKEVRVDPSAMAGLVQGWTRPSEEFPGLIWYRVADFWRKFELALADAVSGNVRESSSFRHTCRSPLPKPALVEIELINAGDADQFLFLPFPPRGFFFFFFPGGGGPEGPLAAFSWRCLKRMRRVAASAASRTPASRPRPRSAQSRSGLRDWTGRILMGVTCVNQLDFHQGWLGRSSGTTVTYVAE